jgi:hypothetical protein
VFTAIHNIERTHGTTVIDQQCFKDHASGTRAQDAGRILRWLEDNEEEYTRTNFNKYLDGLVLLKLCSFHFNSPEHATGMDFPFEEDGKTVRKKFAPWRLVHSDWRMLLLVSHQSPVLWSP